MQTKSENHKTCRCVVLSHVEAVVKNCKGFEQIVTSDAKNPNISTCEGERNERKRERERRPVAGEDKAALPSARHSVKPGSR